MTKQNVDTSNVNSGSIILSELDLETEAIVAFKINFDLNGEVFDSFTMKSADEVIEHFSRLKYGDKKAIDYFAFWMVARATSSPNFVEFLQKASGAGKQVYFTSPGIYNVPSSSNLLLKAVVARLNIWLTKQGMPSVLIYELKKTSVGDPNYSKKPASERQSSLCVIPMPTDFEDSFVVFVDDIYISGSVANLFKTSILAANPAGVLFLLGACLSEEALSQNGATIEEKLNTWVIDGSLESVLEILCQPDLEVVQKTLRVVLDPDNFDSLKDFLDNKIPDQNLLKLYYAAANNDFWNRYQARYAASLRVLEQVLVYKGWLNMDGLAILRKRKARQHNKKLAVIELDSRDQISPDLADLYSRMKYGDPRAVRAVAMLMVQEILADPEASCWVNDLKVVSITSSAYGQVPTAANAVALDLAYLLKERGVSVEYLKIERLGDFGTTHYGNMLPDERLVRMRTRKIYIKPETQEKLRGAKLIIVDDVNVTGSHERTLNEAILTTQVDDYLFCYFLNFSDAMADRDPQAEEYLNRAAVKTVLDLIPFFGEDQKTGLPFRVNARAAKFLLATNPDDECSLDKQTKVEMLITFLKVISDEVLVMVYTAATSTDGYSTNPRFKDGFRLVENEMLERDLISIRQLNDTNNRIVSRNITLDQNGQFVDMETGQDLNDLVRRYSLAKFGGALEIDEFAQDLAQTFVSLLDEVDSPLLRHFQEISASQQFVVLFTPGSRNVESASNIILAKTVEIVNVDLTLRGLSTIVFSHLSRLHSNTANYASLSMHERESRPDSTKTVLPGEDLYANGIHVMFGDDIRITGTTADRIEHSANHHGALSFYHIYTMLLDPRLAISIPSLESDLNQYVVEGKLDECIEYIVNQENFRPVQRLLRLVLNSSNRLDLLDFLKSKVSDQALFKLYVASLNNDYLSDQGYAPSVHILKQAAIDRGLVSTQGRIVKK